MKERVTLPSRWAGAILVRSAVSHTNRAKIQDPAREPPSTLSAYEREVARLGSTFVAAVEAGGAAIKPLLERVMDRPAVFVGSGGAFAVAQLAADLHVAATGLVARAVTPLEFAAMRMQSETAAVMFTASGKHPDAAMTIAAAKSYGYAVIGVVTLRVESELPAGLRGDCVQVVTVPSSSARDGFLATNSVLAMATALVAGSGAPLQQNPSALALLGRPSSETLRPKCLVLYGPRHSCVALDLESRLHEIGLSAVQACDYRNFAHGRHAGLARHLQETTVIALVAPEYEGIAEQTLRELPPGTHLVRLETQAHWPVSALDLLAGSIQMIAPSARVQRINPAKPGVAPFGRKLYHLAVDRPQALPITRLPVRRKMALIGRARFDASLVAHYERSYAAWLETLQSADLGGVVLDYDGTCCTTAGRYDLPAEPVRAELLRLLEVGFVVGFASGRGDSLHADLRKWVPERRWNQIRLGLYNGALELRLSDPIDDQDDCGGALAEMSMRLRNSVLEPLIKIRERTHQLRVEPRVKDSLNGVSLADVVREVIEREPALPLKALASAHSVDVVLRETTKRAVLAAVQAESTGLVLAIGDQGHVGGNDFEMLAATTASLSVDRCSSDPTRCWNLDEAGNRGPDVLVTYLRALRKMRRGRRFSWRTS